MGRNDICDKVVAELLKKDVDDAALSEQAAAHIAVCEKCRAEKKKIAEMQKLIGASTPEVPHLRTKVLERIKNEDIKIYENTSSRRHIPFGTISAAVAVIAVVVSVYGIELLTMFKTAETNSAIGTSIYDATITEDAVDEEASEVQSQISEGHKILSADGTAGAAAAGSASEHVADSGEMYFVEFESKTRDEESGEAITKTDDNRDGETTYAANAPQTTSAEKSHDIVMNERAETTPPTNGDTAVKNVAKLSPDATQEETLEAAEAPEAEAETEMDTAAETDFESIDDVNTEGALSDGDVDVEATAEMIFEKYSELYPQRITRTMFEKFGGKMYLDFVDRLENPETDYTAEAFESFATKYTQREDF